MFNVQSLRTFAHCELSSVLPRGVLPISVEVVVLHSCAEIFLAVLRFRKSKCSRVSELLIRRRELSYLFSCNSFIFLCTLGIQTARNTNIHKYIVRSLRFEPSSRTSLNGEQPYPWELLRPQDEMSRHRGAELRRRFGLLGETSLLSPE